MNISALLSMAAWVSATYVTLGMICGCLLLMYRRSLRNDANKLASVQNCDDSQYLTAYEEFLARASFALFRDTVYRWPIDLSRALGINGWFKARSR